MSEVGGIGVEVLRCAYSAVVGIRVRSAWLVVEMGESEEDMRPVLLEHGVCLVEDEKLDGGEKVAVEVFGTRKIG